MGLNWNFQRGGGIEAKKPSVGGVWIFSGTTQLIDHIYIRTQFQSITCFLVIIDFNQFLL